jgi:hypothetical protein
MADALLVLTKNNPSNALHQHDHATQSFGQRSTDADSSSPTSSKSTDSTSNNKSTTAKASGARLSKDADGNTTESKITGTNTTGTDTTGTGRKNSNATGSESATDTDTGTDTDIVTIVSEANDDASLEDVASSPSRRPSPYETDRKITFVSTRAVVDYDEEPFPESSYGLDDAGILDGSGASDADDVDDYELLGTFAEGSLSLLAQAPIIHRADTRVIIHWNAATGMVNFENGPPVDHPRLQALLCDAQLDIQHTGENGQPTGLVTTAYHANWRQDRYLAYRDGVCRYPLCPGKGKTQAHHLFEDPNERITCVTRMVNLCYGDHTDHHDGQLEISGDPEGVVIFTHSDGRKTYSAARPVPPKLRPNPVPLRRFDRKAG